MGIFYLLCLHPSFVVAATLACAACLYVGGGNEPPSAVSHCKDISNCSETEEITVVFAFYDAFSYLL